MNQPEQPNEPYSDTIGFGMNADDLSMLSQVLQQVKGISGVSGPAYEIIDSAHSSDA